MYKTGIRVYSPVTRDCHPGMSAVLACLESLAQKNKAAFAACFGKQSHPGFFANLPGSVKVRSVKKFIDMHDEFLESPISAFVYGELSDGFGDEHFFTCSVPADVTLPNSTKRRVNIDLTVFKNAGQPVWVPGRFINTVVDPSQAVLHD